MRLIRFKAKQLHGFLDFNIKFEKRLTFLTGINGTGKTTVLNAIVALITPDLSALFDFDYEKIQIEFENDGKKVIVYAENINSTITINASNIDKPFTISKYIPDPDQPLHRQKDSELEHYRDLAANKSNHPILKLISSLPTPMFLGLDRRARFDEDRRPPRYAPGRLLRTGRNIFGVSLAYSLMDAAALAENRYRDALISSGRLAEDLQQEMLLDLLTVAPGDRQVGVALLSIPTAEDRREIETVRQDLETLPQILDLPKKEIQKRITPFLDMLSEFANTLPLNANIQDIIKFGTEGSPEFDALLGWSYNQIHLKRIKVISASVSSYNQNRTNILSFTTNYLNLVNGYLNDSGKSISFDNQGNISVTIEGVADRKLVNSLSSGEAQIFVILTHLAFNPLAKENNIFIIDEPELSLHVQWQELFVDSLVSANPNIQYILATHSPSIILDRISLCVDLGRKKRQKRSKVRRND